MSRPLIAAAAVALALLAGCGDSAEPSPPPTSEDALTTTDAVEETQAPPTTEAPETEEPEADGPPQMPDEATEKTEAGAEAFVEYYVDAFNYAYAAGDPHVMEPLNGEDCKSCEALAGLLSGPSDETRYLTLKDLSGTLIGNAAIVEAPLKQAATESTPEQSGTAIFDLDLGPQGWVVSEITVKNNAA